MMFNKIIVFIIFNTILCEISDNEINDCNLPQSLIDEIATYAPVVEKITRYAVEGDFKGVTYDELAKFIDKYGSRMSGTENLENAIDYMLNLSTTYNLEDVHGEDVDVPYWPRGEETAKLLEPLNVKLSILGIGSSVGTPPEGITAEAVVVKNFDELQALAKEVPGKIVVYNQDWISYGVSVEYRTRGAVEAAKLGAVASLVRSVTPQSLYTLHAGWQQYDDNVTKIPTACITVEDANMLHRMYKRGSTIRIFLKMLDGEVESRKSRNTVAEITGSVNSEQFVLVSGHLDSWDVGKGAMDDGGGVFISWGAVALLKKLNLRAKRTVRVVLWTGEEPGLVGAFAYDKAHDIENFDFVIESDGGTFEPYGIQYNSNTDGGCIIQEIAKLLEPINTTRAEYSNDVGSDITIWEEKGISGATLFNDDANYYWFHHSDADTMDLENSSHLDKGTAIYAALAYVVADLSIDFPKITDPKGILFKKKKTTTTTIKGI